MNKYNRTFLNFAALCLGGFIVWMKAKHPELDTQFCIFVLAVSSSPTGIYNYIKGKGFLPPNLAKLLDDSQREPSVQ